MTQSGVWPGTTLPCAGWVTIKTRTIVAPQPFASASLAVMQMVLLLSWQAVACCALATGQSFTGPTWMAKVFGCEESLPWQSTPPLSFATTVTVAEPQASGAEPH